MSEAQRLAGLRLQLVERHPFWGHLLLHVRFVEAPALETFAATDCVRTIWTNPRFTEQLALPELGFVILHELGHHIFASRDRARGRDPHLWNCATDYAINRTVAAIRDPARPREPLYRPPSGHIEGLGEVAPLLDARWTGVVAEVIYEHLVASALPSPQRITVTLPDGGALPGVLDHGGGIDVHLPDAVPESIREQLRDRIRAAVGTANDAMEPGDAPGALVRGLGRPRRAQLPWRRLLHRYAVEALNHVDYSYRRPNRRYLAQDLIVPGLVREEQPDVVVALDTSASMDADILDQAAAELTALAATTPQVTVVVADARIHEVVEPAHLASWLTARRFEGGGGTDHRPVFDWLGATKRRPDLFVGLTDLYTTLPEQRPGYPVLWVTPEDHAAPPWGRVVEVTRSSPG